MATDKEFIEFINDQMQLVEGYNCKSMFGEYGLYAKGKFIGVVCDNKLFIKPTDSGRAFIGEVVEAPPYKGAKNYFLIEDNLDDREWLSELLHLTADELPAPKQKKKKGK